MLLPVTITYTVIAVAINLGLAVRIGKVRMKESVLHGDGGNPLLARRIRAHSNFIEYTPFALILCALIEMASGGQMWLWLVMGAFSAGRISHGLGMDSDEAGPARKLGMMLTFLPTIILGGAALYVAFCPVA
jgi:uncharacterized protein